MERVGKIAYAYINVDGPTDNLAPYICSTLFLAAPIVHCRLCASSRGHMLLCFNSHGDLNAMVDLRPIIHNGTCLTLEQSEETSNRFEIVQPWLVAILTIDFLEGH